MNIDSPLYLDYNATTPCDPRVIQEMLPYFGDKYGNSSSVHSAGRLALRALDIARDTISRLLGVPFDDVIFTSGATEAIQLSLERLPSEIIESDGIATSQIEHRAVQNSLARLERRQGQVRRLGTIHGGVVDLESIDRPAVYVIQAANSETGILQDITRVGELVREVGGLLLCDAAQALWKLPLSSIAEQADAFILSAHKSFGPKGVGALIANERYRRLLRSGRSESGQEQDIREGTANIPLIVGFAKALSIEAEEGAEWRKTALEARDELERSVMNVSSGAVYPHFGDLPRLPNTSSLRISGVPAEILMANLRDIAISFGSACSSGSPEPSKALLASGVSREAAMETVRVSLGPRQGVAIGNFAGTLLANKYLELIRQ